jgi:manganese transport protein
VKVVFQIALGIIAAIGGFVDIGDLVFNIEAGATFGYRLLWAVPIGVLGIILFAEMSGRVAAVAGKANFDLVHEHYPRRLALVTLAASLVLSFLTLAAELGGMGIVIDLFFDVSPQLFMLAGVAIVMLAAALLPFEAIERIFGYGGLALCVYAVAGVDLDPDWSAIGHGLVPESPSSALYAYYAVGLIAAALMPYEIYFYSSGALEEQWHRSDLVVNRLNAVVGYSIGGLLSVALMIVSAQVFLPAGVDPGTIGSVALAAQVPFGELGLLLAMVGIFFALGGAAIDTCFSGAYNLAQMFGWNWGLEKGIRRARKWHITVAVLFLGGYGVVATGIDPVALTEYAVVLSVIALPLTYWPILKAAGDRELMGDKANGAVTRVLGWAYFVLICALTVAAPVLLVVTNGGGG